MSELWIVIPPPRREPEVTLTISFAVALAVHVFPLIASDPAPPDLGVEIYDEGPCHFGSFDHEPTEICAVTDLSSRFEPVRRPTFDSLIYLDESDCTYCWYGRTWEVEEPQAEETRPEPEPISRFPLPTSRCRSA